MKIKILLVTSILCGFTLKSQNYFNLTPGFATGNFQEWNQTIRAYNFARPWLKEELPEIRLGLHTGAGFTAILAKAFFISPEINYTLFHCSAKNQLYSSTLNLHIARGQIQFDIFPREVGLDSVWFTFRPFVRIGAGGTTLIPRFRLNEKLVEVRDVKYNPLVWTYHFTFGAGFRYSLSRKFDLMPLIQFFHHPNTELTDFAQAIHGTAVPELTNRDNFFTMQFSIACCFRIGTPDITER